MKEHQYQIDLKWIGNEGEGTKDYRSYNRNFEISAPLKEHIIEGSSDPNFRGDSSRYNPEDTFVSSLASCHMLWFLHLCSTHKIAVLEYQDKATGIMVENKDGSGHFKEVTLHPDILVASPVDPELIDTLHAKANTMCFIANSCNFPIHHQPTVRTV
nr:OsmC family protein [Allomuricauda sp.]